ncbi:MAG TPA: hypothetical protein ENH87_11105 [Pricia antarctica]|uniref:Uncharacterized protein n=1 Tax=Pricia antarctica TaxID=641691 RepID=A0A831QMQ1_9FLAO|nr:hypothetical protein [Pricia antarctica]
MKFGLDVALLKEVVYIRKTSNLKWFAGEIGVSQSYLSQVMYGLKGLGASKRQRIKEVLPRDVRNKIFTIYTTTTKEI